jgi:manganese transport protein
MGGLVEILLGVMTAVGGFVDVSEAVFASQSGSRFAFALMWVFVLATVGLIVFGEMSGRVAAIAKQPVFNLMRQRLGLRLGLVVLIVSVAVCTVTCAAEIGGIGIMLKLLTGAPARPMAMLATLVLLATVWVLPFKWIERTFGLLGLLMLVFLAVTVAIHPPVGQAAAGLIPQVPPNLGGKQLLSFAYFAVAITSAVMFPYETYFYSSGAIEERWAPKDLMLNRITCGLGFSLGTLLALSLVINAAVLFKPSGIDPQLPGSVALQAAIPFGRTGLIIALLGMLLAFGGAAVETGLAGAYCVSQFFGWEWGRYRKPQEAPRFTFAWIAVFLAALALVLTGIKPLQLVEWAVVSSIVVLPATYLPLILIANDRKYMGQQVNGRISNVLGWGFYALLALAAVAAAPLYLVTSGGRL